MLKSPYKYYLTIAIKWRNFLEDFTKDVHLQVFAGVKMNMGYSSTNNRIRTVNIFDDYVDKPAKCSC